MLSSVNSAMQLRNLACRRVNLTIPSSTGTPVHVSFCWWYMWMILLSLEVTLDECPKTLITNPGFSKIWDRFHIYIYMTVFRLLF